MSTEKHIHKLKRHTYRSGREVYFCILPDCNFKINPPLALGKRTICHRCHKPFILTEYSIRLVKPHCEACHKSKRIEVHPEVIENESKSEPAQVSNDLRSRLEGSITALLDKSISDEDEDL